VRLLRRKARDSRVETARGAARAAGAVEVPFALALFHLIVARGSDTMTMTFAEPL
jgi:hypothetical protein